MNEFERFLIVDTMSTAYQGLEKVVNKLIQLNVDLETELMESDEEFVDDIDIDVIEYLSRILDLENERDDVMQVLSDSVLAMPQDMQEYDFKDDIEYKSLHDGVYKFIHDFVAYSSAIIEVCLFIDEQTTAEWALENGLLDEEEGEDE